MAMFYRGPRCPFCQSEKTWTKIIRTTKYRNGVAPLVEDYRRAYCDSCGDSWQDESFEPVWISGGFTSDRPRSARNGN